MCLKCKGSIVSILQRIRNNYYQPMTPTTPSRVTRQGRNLVTGPILPIIIILQIFQEFCRLHRLHSILIFYNHYYQTISYHFEVSLIMISPEIRQEILISLMQKQTHFQSSKKSLYSHFTLQSNKFYRSLPDKSLSIFFPLLPTSYLPLLSGLSSSR